MKKQGPPPPLDESRFLSKKQQNTTNSAKTPAGKKRSAPKDVVAPPAKKRQNTPTNGSSDRKSGPGRTHGGSVKTSQVKRLSLDEDMLPDGSEGSSDFQGYEDDERELSDKSELEDEMEDEMELGDGLDLSDQDGKNGGEFLDSGSSVYDSDQDQKTAMFSEDEDESDAEQKLTAANMEGLSRRYDAEAEAKATDGQLELEEAALQTNIDSDREKILEDDSEDDGKHRVKSKLHLAPDLQLLRTRIADTVRVLGDFSKFAEHGCSRADYTAQLLKDITVYYGYSPFLAEKLMNLFSPREAFEFFEANESPRPVVLRTNTLKTHRRELAQALINRGVTLEPVGKWSKVGLQVFESQVPLGATPEYMGGHYILQAASSFLPVMALDPQEHERVLDMAAAPGGKTTHLAALMRNTGCIFANDSNRARAKALIGNIHRLGATNTIVCSYDARAFPRVIGGFDRVLLDAPCSGTGIIAKDPSVKTNKNARDFLALPHMQKQLLLAAIDSVDHASRAGGVIVYSTCSVTVEENEQVVQYALRKRPNVRIIDTGLPFGVEAFVRYMGKVFDQKMKLARRYYPHTYNVDGFFVCKLRKIGPSPKGAGEGAGALAGKEDAGDVQRDENGIDKLEEKDDDFGGWDDEEDDAYLERARRSWMRRKGMNPKAKKDKR